MSVINLLPKYRNLTSDEIDSLVRQGCTADDWDDILVDPDFNPDLVVRSSFHGRVCIGLGSVVRDARCYSHGRDIHVLSETGMRPVLVHPGLSPFTAYVQAFHAYRGEGLARRLREAVELYACPCVIDDGAVVDQATLRNCYVGPGVHIEEGFSAEESIFLYGSHLAKGEACALLAGPFTVSHHKSTLLIAAATSFFNAGSGSNQSNHSYKLGPNKFGILERGAKLGSSSYLFWPARVGAFSTVLGHHMAHFDLHDLPFSYVIGEEGRSVVIPAVALQSIGTLRDEHKWKRRGAKALTPLTFCTLSPYTAGRIRAGIRLLEGLRQTEPAVLTTTLGVRHKYYRLGDCLIPTRAVEKGIDLYRDALLIYGVGMLCARIARRLPLTASDEATGPWLDYLGLVLPQQEATDAALRAMDAAAPLGALDDALRDLLARLGDWEWNWVSRMLADEFGLTPAQADDETLRDAIGRYTFAVRHCRLLLHFDIDKEFNQEASLLYGIDGTPDDARRDFDQTIGSKEADPTCRMLDLIADVAIRTADRALAVLAEGLPEPPSPAERA